MAGSAMIVINQLIRNHGRVAHATGNRRRLYDNDYNRDQFMAEHTQPILRWTDGSFQETTDELSEEEPLEIRVRGRAVSITMRTSGHDDELAAGFLLTEGVIRNRADILKIEPCDRN